MNIRISPQQGIPIYRQITNQISYMVAAGRLKANDEIPPIRVLAEQLLINPNTVARAYRELEVAGIVSKRQGAGTFITNGKSPLAKRERIRILSERIDALLTEADQMNVPFDQLTQLLQERQSALESPHEEA